MTARSRQIAEEIASDEARDRYQGAKEQAQAQFESIREMVEALQDWERALEADGWESFTDQFEVPSWRHADGATWAGTAKQVCEAHGLDVEWNENAQQRIHEDALSVEVRSDWYTPGSSQRDADPSEYRILLCTGGPAVQITGRLNGHGEPEGATLQMQDWFLPWTDYRPVAPPNARGEALLVGDAEEILLAYARQFYFGE